MLSYSFGATDLIPIPNAAGQRLSTFIQTNGQNMTVAVDDDSNMTVTAPIAALATLPAPAPAAPAKPSKVPYIALGIGGLLAGVLIGRLVR